MSKEYAENRVQEALEKHQGDNVRARQQIMAWAHEDHKLLTELTKIHLKGIAAYWVDRVKSKRGAPKPVPQTPVVEKQEREEEQSFGEEMLRSFASGGSQTFGLEDSVGNVGRRAASKNHIDAITKIAKKGQSKLPRDAE